MRAGNDSTLEVAPDDLNEAKYLTFRAIPPICQDVAVFIVTVPTPIDQANRPDLTPLIKASEMIGKVMPNGAVVIYKSTVYPGATEEVCVPALERASGKRFNEEFFCGYSPERIVPGDKLHTLKTIVKVTSGSTPAIADAVDKLYARSSRPARTRRAASRSPKPRR